MKNPQSIFTPADLSALVAENERRKKALDEVKYDPVTGEGCVGERRKIRVQGHTLWLPMEMINRESADTLHNLEKCNIARLQYDFEYWCVRCVQITHKVTHELVSFVLNRPQREVVEVLERQRTAGVPMRIILLKARQWGGSTVIQMYMAWIQITRRENWNSLICGHLRDTAGAIKGMYSRLLDNYPDDCRNDEKPWRFRPFESSRNVSQIDGRGNLVIMASAGSQEAVRGYDVAMAHLTEVAFWPATPQHSPADVMRAVGGTVAMEPDTLVAIESTANGMGNFFHSEWLRAKAGNSDKTAIFVPWYKIDIYKLPVADPKALWLSLDEYERNLWTEHRCTLEAINWYHQKRKEYVTHELMMAEFPSTDTEAFSNTDCAVFDIKSLNRLYNTCMPPLAIGEVDAEYKTVNNVRFNACENGNLQIWDFPNPQATRHQYVVTVDVGGRSVTSDWSVIAVIDRRDMLDDIPQVVAQWRGHLDHDLLAWKAAQIAKYYRNALLVIESNTLETEQADAGAGDYILQTIASAYRHCYYREKGRLGFHTNAKTKNAAIYNLIAYVRDRRYVERDAYLVDEMGWYVNKPDGGFGARDGKNDDVLMTRAIGLYVIERQRETRRRTNLRDRPSAFY